MDCLFNFVVWLWIWQDIAFSLTVKTDAEKSFDVNKTTMKV